MNLDNNANDEKDEAQMLMVEGLSICISVRKMQQHGKQFTYGWLLADQR